MGKSTLFNRIVGDERSVVHDMPGTTRDTIDTVVETPEGPLRFIDTAGMRRRSRGGGGRARARRRDRKCACGDKNYSDPA